MSDQRRGRRVERDMPGQREGVEFDDGYRPPVLVGDKRQALHGPIFVAPATAAAPHRAPGTALRLAWELLPLCPF